MDFSPMRWITIICLFVCGMATSRSQSFTFSTFAGNAGYGSADGTNTSARFDFPQGVAADAAGNIYVADTQNSTIRRIDSAGVVTTLAGSPGNIGNSNGVGSMARFSSPQGIATDMAGNVYVADTANSAIRRITPAGVVTTIAGSAGIIGSANGTNSGALFNWPAAIVVNSAGVIYVADTYNSTIRMISPAGSNWVTTTLAGVANATGAADGTNLSARFYQPFGIAVDTNGYIYVADSGNNAVRKIALIDTNWVTTTLLHVDYPSGVTIDGATVYVTDPHNTIRKITASETNWTATLFAGIPGKTGSTDGTTQATLNYPRGLTTGTNGTVYVADSLNNTIRRVTRAGVVSTVAGNAGGQGISDGVAAQARFNAPQGVAVDVAGNVYVADSQNNTIRLITAGGVVTTLAGVATNPPGIADGIGSRASFFRPIAIAVDANTNLFVADYYNNRIRKLSRAGTNWAVSTFPSYVTNSFFNHPAGLALDQMANLYVADGGTNGVRFITPDGTASTLPGSIGSYQVRTNQLVYESTSVAVDEAGNVYVTDSANNTIRQITPNGTVTTIAGLPGSSGIADGSGTNARFASPLSIAVDAQTNLFVADQFSHTIRMVSPSGTNWIVSTIGGSPGLSGSADGSGDTQARFNHPSGVATDALGDVYVADTDNNTIRFGRSVTATLDTVTLRASLVGNQIIITWPASASTFNLEINTNYAAGGVWLPVAALPVVVDTNLVLSSDMTAPAAIFRLHKP